MPRPTALPDPETSPKAYENILPKRFLAWCIDIAITLAASLIALPFTAFLGLLFFPFLFLIVGFFYRWWTVSWSGATIGMRLLAIELRDAQGHKLDSRTALLHAAGYSVSISVFVLQLGSIIMMVVDDKHRGLSDVLLDTAMINRLR